MNEEKKYIITLELLAESEQKAFELLQELITACENFKQLSAQVEDLVVEEDE